MEEGELNQPCFSMSVGRSFCSLALLLLRYHDELEELQSRSSISQGPLRLLTPNGDLNDDYATTLRAMKQHFNDYHPVTVHAHDVMQVAWVPHPNLIIRDEESASTGNRRNSRPTE